MTEAEIREIIALADSQTERARELQLAQIRFNEARGKVSMYLWDLERESREKTPRDD
jgi:hypothetical protein